MPRVTKKPPKDPNAPKKPLSSYFIFSNERRAVMAKQMPDKKLTELSKLISAEWKELDTATKESYAQRCAQAKKEYAIQFDAYKRTENYRVHERKLAAWKSESAEFKGQERSTNGGSSSSGVSLPRKPKDTNAPKRSKTSYFLFGDSVREATKLEHPKAKITEIARIIGAKWKELSDDEKRPFADEAKRLKALYNEEMARYKDSDEERAYQRKLDEWKAECQRRKQAAAGAKSGRSKGKGRRAMVEDSSDEESSSEGEESESRSGTGTEDESSDESGSEESDSQSSSGTS